MKNEFQKSDAQSGKFEFLKLRVQATEYFATIWTVEGGTDNQGRPHTLLITMHASEEIFGIVEVDSYKYHVIGDHDLEDDHLDEVVRDEIRIKLNHPNSVEFN